MLPVKVYRSAKKLPPKEESKIHAAIFQLSHSLQPFFLQWFLLYGDGLIQQGLATFWLHTNKICHCLFFANPGHQRTASSGPMRRPYVLPNLKPRTDELDRRHVHSHQGRRHEDRPVDAGHFGMRRVVVQHRPRDYILG